MKWNDIGFIWKVARWGGSVDWDHASQIPNGVATLCRNARFRAESVATRFGRKHSMALALPPVVLPITKAIFTPGSVPNQGIATATLTSTTGLVAGQPIVVAGVNVVPYNGDWIILSVSSTAITWAMSQAFVGAGFGGTVTQPGVAAVTGLDVLNVIVNNPGQIPVLFTDSGRMFKESPVGSGTLVEIVASGGANYLPPFPGGAYMHDTLAYNRMYQAFSDGKKGVYPPLVLNGPTGNLSFVGQTPVGALWTQGIYYRYGDLVRALDGRWWRCWLGAGNLSGSKPPAWPPMNGYFAGGTFVRAQTFDPVGGSQWEEWTPACAQYLPAPQIGNLITHAPGTGTILAGKDVYIKLAYTPGVGSPMPESPRSVAAVFVNTSANDAVTISSTDGSSTGGIPAPRWVAEIFLDPTRFSGSTLQLNVYTAVVAHGAAEPADSSYLFFHTTSALNPVAVGSSSGTGAPVTQLGCPIVYSGLPGPAPVFFGEGGTRYMIILRENQNSSLSPVDPGSPIPVNLIGQIQQQIISIVRDSSGNVNATVGDITAIAVGQGITVQGCQGDGTFNGSFKITNVRGTLAPNGILTWKDVAHLSASNDTTGELILPAGPPPVSFLPPGGTDDMQDIAAFTVAAPQGGQSVDLQAGPYTYISESIPNKNFSTPILSMQGPLTLKYFGGGLTRYAGGFVQCVFTDITGITVGAQIIIASATDASFDGTFTITGISPGTGTGGIVAWTQTDTAASTATTTSITISIGSIGQVQATVVDPSGLAAGSIVNITAPVNVGAGFTGPTVLASVAGNVVTFPSPATGSGPGLGSGTVMTVMQELPTVSSAASPLGFPSITSISRDDSGNVTAVVPSLLGYTAGQVAQVISVSDSSFNALVELISATLNGDGITGTLTWVQAGLGASSPTGGNIITTPFVNGVPSGIAMLLNFDDNALTNGTDVTKQLTAMPPPNSLDVYYCETLDRVIYTTGIDSQHYVSNLQDAENIDELGGLLSVATANGQKTICIREMISGEIISLKERGGYAIEPNSLAPNQWGETKRWDKHGPVNNKAVGVGSDFLIIFVQYSGVYRYYSGKLDWISREKQGTWDRVNWDYKHTIWCEVDEDNNCVRLGLPLDGATTPNKEVVLNYFNGWEEPLTENYQGQVIPNRRGRRWTENDLTAASGKVVNRAISVDSRINARQMLYGRGYASGLLFVDMEVPDQYYDEADGQGANGYSHAGIDFHYRPAFARSETLDLIRFLKIKGRILGSGAINFLPITEDPGMTIPAVTVVQESAAKPTKFQVGIQAPNDEEMLSFDINNGAVAGAWTELQDLIIGGNERYPGQPTQ